MVDPEQSGTTVYPQRRQGPTRSGEDRRKVNIPPPPGSPARSGVDRRKADRRGNSAQAGKQHNL